MWKLSAQRRIPVLCALNREYYPWQLLGFLIHWVKHRQYESRYHYSKFGLDQARLSLPILDLWGTHYLPRTRIDENALILDAGAGEGETLVFFAAHGYRNFIAVEPELMFYEHLKANIKQLEVSVILRRKMFSLADLEGVSYAKIDVEGGETELLKLERVPCEMLVEVHGTELFSRFKKKWPNLALEWKLVGEQPMSTIFGVRIMQDPSRTC